jgi:hypothetical protein
LTRPPRAARCGPAVRAGRGISQRAILQQSGPVCRLRTGTEERAGLTLSRARTQRQHAREREHARAHTKRAHPYACARAAAREHGARPPVRSRACTLDRAVTCTARRSPVAGSRNSISDSACAAEGDATRRRGVRRQRARYRRIVRAMSDGAGNRLIAAQAIGSARLRSARAWGWPVRCSSAEISSSACSGNECLSVQDRNRPCLAGGQRAGELAEYQRCVGEAQAARVAGGKTAPHAPAGISRASDHWFLSRCCSQLYTDDYIQQKFSVQRWLEVPSQTYL